MHLGYVRIENIRQFGAFELDLGGVHPARRRILVGRNGAGKSTILRAIADGLDDLNPANAPRIRSSDKRRRASVAVPASDGEPDEGSMRVELDYRLTPAERRRVLKATGGEQIGGTLVGIQKRLLRRTRLEWRSPLDPGEEQEAALEEEAVIAVALWADRGILTESPSEVAVGDLINPNRVAGSMARGDQRYELLAARLLIALLAPDARLQRLMKVLAKYFPELPRLVVGRRDDLWFETRAGLPLRLTDLSDGERALLLLFSELYFRDVGDGVVLIDEPEQHLHPAWLIALLDGLAALCPEAQFIVATQADYLATSNLDDLTRVGGE